MNKDFSENLRDYVSKEKQNNPYINETALSKKMGIPPTTFNRLINGHSKPTAKTLSKLLNFIPELKSSLPKEISQILEVSLEREQRTYVEDTLAVLLSDKYIFLCWSMAFSDEGVKREEIEKYFGWKGLSALSALLEKDILIKDDKDFYKIKDKDKNTIFSFRLLKAHLLFLAEQYKPDNLKNNYIHYWVGFLNTQGEKKLMKAHQDFHRVVRGIMEDEENKGNRPIFSIACSDWLLGKEIKENE